MKCIGFIGKVDKSDLISYVSKIITCMGKKVIMIDATTDQKTRYTIPVMSEMEDQAQYIIQQDGIEIAIGFSNILELKKYLLSKGDDFNDYDYVIVDTDQEEMIEEYDLKDANENFFVSSYDKFYIQKGIELLRCLCALKRRTDTESKIHVNKCVFYSDVNTADSKYIERLADNLPLEWDPVQLNYPYDHGDLSVNIQNQYTNKFDVRLLSREYKDALAQTVQLITEDDLKMIKKVIKNIERVSKFS